MSITSFRLGRFAAFSAKTSSSARSCSISSRASGRWTLTTTFCPVASERAMDLRDRPGGERLGFHGLEHVLPRHAELLLHHGDDLCLRQGRHVVLQGREFLDELGGRRSGRVERICRACRTWDRAPRARPGAASPGADGPPPPPRRDDRTALAGRAWRRRRRSWSLAPPGAGWITGSTVRGADRPRGARASDRRRLTVRRVHDDHRAAGVVADPVRDVAEQELLPPCHAGIADDQDVDRLLLGGIARSPSRDRRRSRRGRVRAHRRAAWCRPAARRPRSGPASPRRRRAPCRRRAPARSPGRCGARRRTARRTTRPTPRPSSRSRSGPCPPSRGGRGRWGRSRCVAMGRIMAPARARSQRGSPVGTR